MEVNYTEILGYVAASLTTLAFIPQLVRIVKTGSTKDISWLMYSVFLSGVLLWLAYGICIESLPVILANAVTSLLAITILALKYRYEK